MKNLALVLMLAVSMTACKTNKKAAAEAQAAKDAGYASGKSDAEARAVKAANFMVALEATVSPGTVVTAVKFAKDKPNMLVFSYQSGSTTIYYAVDISSYVAGTNVSTYAMSHEIYFNITPNGDGTFSCNAGACMTVSGGSTVATSNSIVFEKTSLSSKDMDKAAAFVEANKVENMAAGLASEFGLSEERSLKVAKLAASWDKLAKTRAITDADAEAFSKELTGVSMADMENAEKAMIDGSMVQMNAVIAKAAEVNGTTSENMSAIMQKLFF